jgi:hypothetical protein
MDNRELSTRSGADYGGSLRLPIPPQALKEHRPLPIETIVQQMEAMLEAAKLGPEFEAMRLRQKNSERFRT